MERAETCSTMCVLPKQSLLIDVQLSGCTQNGDQLCVLVTAQIVGHALTLPVMIKWLTSNIV